jgi:predicted deacylase
MNILLLIREHRWILEKEDRVVRLDSSGSGYGKVVGSCLHGIELVGSITYWKVVEQLSDWQLLEKDSSPWS